MENFLVTHNPNITELSRKRKDYIAEPKINGYSSLHTTRIVHIPDKDIKFYRETQIKTFRMRETEKMAQLVILRYIKTIGTYF